MNYNDIEGMSNEEAVVYFGVLTNSGIPCGDLENLLGWAGLAERDPITGSWAGSLIDFMNSNAVPALGEGLQDLFSHLNKPRSETVDTTVHSWASEMDALLGGLVQAGVVTQLFADDVVALGGGYAYPDLDADAVQAIRDEEAVRVAAEEAQAIEDAARAEFDVKMQRYNELYNIHISPLATDANADDAAWVAALQAMSDEFVVVE